MDGMQAEIPEFQVATDAINDTLDTLGGKSGNLGRGFSDFGLTPKEASKQEAQKASEDFAERWEWGVRALCESASNYALALGLSAGSYHRMDDQVQTMFKIMHTNVLGNPHLSRDEISKRGWEETRADNPVNHEMHPDFSMEADEAMLANEEANRQIRSESGPQALSNVLTIVGGPSARTDQDGGGLPGLPDPSFHSGQMERSAQIKQGGQ